MSVIPFLFQIIPNPVPNEPNNCLLCVGEISPCEAQWCSAMIKSPKPSSPSWKAALALLLRLQGHEGQGLGLDFSWISASGAMRQGTSLVWLW